MRWFLIMLCAALVACATPYQRMGLMGGVDELQLNDTTYRITARGNGFTDPERVQDFVLLKASQIALARGYAGFLIAGAENQSRISQFTTPGYGSVNTFGTVTGNPEFATLNADSTATYTPPMTHTIFKPGVSTIVILVKNGGMNAQMIYNRLAPEYQPKQLQ